MDSGASHDLPFMLRNVDEATKAYLKVISTNISLAKKESLPRQSNPPQHIIFLRSGWLSLSMQGTTVSLLKEGDAFHGPVLPYDSCSSSQIVLTAVTEAKVTLIEKVPLFVTLQQRPDLLFSLYEQTCERLTRLYIRLARQQVDSVDVRLASLLWGVGVPREGGHRALPPISQSVIAACMGTGREEVSRKRQLIVQSGKLFKVGKEWFISEEIGRMLAAEGYGE